MFWSERIQNEYPRQFSVDRCVDGVAVHQYLILSVFPELANQSNCGSLSRSLLFLQHINVSPVWITIPVPICSAAVLYKLSIFVFIDLLTDYVL